MINAKTVIGVIIVAILVGILYVFVEKNFLPAKSLSQSGASSAQELAKDLPAQTTVIDLPTPEPTLPPIDGSSNLLNEASNLQMRDYSSYFEDLKSKTKQ